MNRKKYNKGLIGAGIIGQFIFAVFIVIFVLIFLFQFKYHIIQMMGEYYLWGKEFDIPLALLSADIDNYPSAIAFNYIYYNDDEFGGAYGDLITEMRDTVDKWFSTPSKSFKYYLQFGNIIIQQEEATNVCDMGIIPSLNFFEKLDSNFGISLPTGSWIYICSPKNVEIKTRSIYGLYPIPVAFNGTDRIIPLEFESFVVMESSE